MAVHLPIIDRPTGVNPSTPNGQSTPAIAVLFSGCACVSVCVCVCARVFRAGAQKYICTRPITMMLCDWFLYLYFVE